MMKLAPIILFVYNRPEHTLQTLESLSKNVFASESDLFVFCDGPKKDVTQLNITKIDETRNIVKSRKWTKSVTIYESEKNLGLANSIIKGVTSIINLHGKAIVLEDDILTSPFFLQYMNEGLIMYEKLTEVVSIHAYTLPVNSDSLPETFFMKGADCWGWATWKNRWEIFEPNAAKLLKELIDRNLTNEFDLEGSYPYTQMLKDQIAGKVDSWAIRWHASAFLDGRYTLYPKKSIVYNIGLDNSGTHCLPDEFMNSQDWNNKLPVKLNYNEIIKNNEKALRLWKKYYKDRHTLIIEQKQRSSIFVRLKSKLKQGFDFLFVKEKKEPEFIEWQGKYSSYEEARSNGSGYDDAVIFDKVKSSTHKVVTGQAVYERDSFIFQEVQHNIPLVETIKNILGDKKSISILDFGGALGSVYNYIRLMFPKEIAIAWQIVEQPLFVSEGQLNFTHSELTFHQSIKDSLKSQIDLLLLSGVLHYLPDPYNSIHYFNNLKTENIIIDRTGFTDETEEYWTIQNVPEYIYKASYPCFFFDENKMLKAFSNYDVISEFASSYDSGHELKGIHYKWKGFHLKLKHDLN